MYIIRRRRVPFFVKADILGIFIDVFSECRVSFFNSVQIDFDEFIIDGFYNKARARLRRFFV